MGGTVVGVLLSFRSAVGKHFDKPTDTVYKPLVFAQIGIPLAAMPCSFLRLRNSKASFEGLHIGKTNIKLNQLQQPVLDQPTGVAT